MSFCELSKTALCEKIETKLLQHFGCELSEAGKVELFKACALVMRDIMAQRLAECENRADAEEKKRVHYMSLEFLIGRSFVNNAYNLGLLSVMRDTLSEIGIDMKEFLETEPDAGLGNGGLGRLAACYIDSMATLGIPATGYSIRYEHGLFKQRIVDGQQIELPDSWLDIGEVWLMQRIEEVRTVSFGGYITESWQDGHMKPVLHDADTVLAVPYDMLIAGYDTENITVLRLWSAKSPVELDMALFSRGEYLKAVERHAMAETISKILYPDDKHIEGKSLRLKQQYFFVSATVQDMTIKHKRKYGTLRNFHEKNIIQINDTHPALVIPELMRILLDEEGCTWDEAWDITCRSVAYTNHTVMPEALEQWPETLFSSLMPRIWSILREINQRFCARLWEVYPGHFDKISKLSLICDVMVRMANLSVVAASAVNGVSKLHSDILRTKVFPDYDALFPGKFTCVTNGIAHRRWLCEINPGLTRLLTDCIGDGFILQPERLSDFMRYSGDREVLERLGAVKRANKAALADYIAKQNGMVIDPDNMLDVQVKRLHEYKRQLLNVLHIIDLYLREKERPGSVAPCTFLFGAKAFPGYEVAKQIIRLICSVSAFIQKDAAVRDIIKVVFTENYRVSLAELIVPAAEVSEQISTAGKEASGTGNMKFMMNGAVTIGTLDGANVEIREAVKDENIFIFGLHADEAERLGRGYDPSTVYRKNRRLRAVIELINKGFGDGVSYHDLVSSLLYGAKPDLYLLIADFESYCDTHDRLRKAYANREGFLKMCAVNIAQSGRFSSDRAVAEYASKIWKL